jgi:cytidylate kinase
MTPYTGVLTRYVEALDQAQRHWQQRQSAARLELASSALTVALTREAGSPGTSIAHEIGKRLGWQVYDHELLELIAREMGLRVSLLESIDERQRSWLLESAEAFASAPGVTQMSYVRHLVETILSLGAHGRCVIVGRGAAQILPADTTLRIRLVAPREDRVTTLAQKLGLSHDAAARRVTEIDRERVRFIQEYFHKNPADLHHYDLVLNTSRWSLSECAELIIDALKRMESKRAAGGTG